MNRRRLARLGALLFAACASSEPSSPSAFDRGAGEARVVIGTDGFGTLDGVRMPVEAIVVRLRHRTRALGLDAMERFVVVLGVQQGVTEAATVRTMQQDLNRMLQQLEIMGVRQVETMSGATR